MAENKTGWMSNGTEWALVDKGDADTWKPRGWSAADEPTDDAAFVYMEHPDEGVTGKARLPWGARAYWQGIGFAPAAPPDPVDLTRDPHLRDQRAEKAPAKPAKATEKTAAKADEPKEK